MPSLRRTDRAKSKRTKKTQNAIKWDVPVMKFEWLENLAERKEEGLKLRTKDEASKYLLEGEVSEDFPQVPKPQKRKEPDAAVCVLLSTC